MWESTFFATDLYALMKMLTFFDSPYTCYTTVHTDQYSYKNILFLHYQLLDTPNNTY